MDKPMTPRAWVALTLVYLMWGSTYLGIRVVVKTLPPLASASVRWIVAGSIMLAIGYRGLRRDQRPTRQQWRNATIIGGALLLGGNGLVSVAEKRIDSGMAALLVATIPLFIALYELAVFRVRPRPAIVGGIALGFVGTAVLVIPNGGSVRVDTIGALVVVAAAAIWAAGSLFARSADMPSRASLSIGMQMICGGAVTLVAASIGGEWSRFHPSEVSATSLIAVGYLIVFGSLIGFTSYAWLLRNAKTSIVATYAYVNPLVAVVLGALILHERITATTGLGGGIIIVSVAIIVAASSPRSKVAPEVSVGDEAQVRA